MLEDGTFEMVRGDTETFQISCLVESGEGGELVEREFANGESVIFVVADKGNSVPKLKKVVTSFVDGKAFVTLSHEDTANMLQGEYVYIVRLNILPDVVKTIIEESRFVLKGDAASG